MSNFQDFTPKLDISDVKGPEFNSTEDNLHEINKRAKNLVSRTELIRADTGELNGTAISDLFITNNLTLTGNITVKNLFVLDGAIIDGDFNIYVQDNVYVYSSTVDIKGMYVSGDIDIRNTVGETGKNCSFKCNQVLEVVGHIKINDCLFGAIEDHMICGSLETENSLLDSIKTAIILNDMTVNDSGTMVQTGNYYNFTILGNFIAISLGNLDINTSYNIKNAPFLVGLNGTTGTEFGGTENIGGCNSDFILFVIGDMTAPNFAGISTNAVNGASNQANGQGAAGGGGAAGIEFTILGTANLNSSVTLSCTCGDGGNGSGGGGVYGYYAGAGGGMTVAQGASSGGDGGASNGINYYIAMGEENINTSFTNGAAGVSYTGYPSPDESVDGTFTNQDNSINSDIRPKTPLLTTADEVIDPSTLNFDIPTSIVANQDVRIVIERKFTEKIFISIYDHNSNDDAANFSGTPAYAQGTSISYTLGALDAGTYRWKVQSMNDVDITKVSMFSESQTFIIT